MKLEVNEELVSQSVTPEELNKLEFTEPVCLKGSEDQYLQLWIDEDDGTREFYFRPIGQAPQCCVVPDEFDVGKLQAVFGDFLAGNHDWSSSLSWEDIPVPGDEDVMLDPESELNENPWEVYPCRFEDDTTALVIYDHGISEHINSIDLKQFVGITIALKTSDAIGHPMPEESETIDDVEEAIATAIEGLDGIYVGCMTFEGSLHYYNYCDATAVQVDEIVEMVKTEFDYDAQSTLEIDPEKTRYWDDLYPPEEGWNLIVDSKVVQSHAEMGDQLQAPRPVEFWIDFADTGNLESFEAWAKGEGFEIERQPAPANEADPQSLMISIESAIELETIHSITATIFAKSKELEGDYAGWECGVVEAVSS